MPLDRVCDTNVCYDLATGRLDPARLKANGARLLLSPFSILEIISNLSPMNFDVRKAAAIAGLRHFDELLPDPESYLAEVWGWNASRRFRGRSRSRRSVMRAI